MSLGSFLDRDCTVGVYKMVSEFLIGSFSEHSHLQEGRCKMAVGLRGGIQGGPGEVP